MSITYVAERFRGLSQVSSTSVVLTLTGTVTKWSLLVLRLAMDNAASGGPGGITISGDGTNSWTTFSVNRNPSGANTGTSLWTAWTIVEDTGFTDLTINFWTDGTHATSQSVQAKAGVVDEWSGVLRTNPLQNSGDTGVGTATSATRGIGIFGGGQLILGAIAIENRDSITVIHDTDTTGGAAWVELGHQGTDRPFALENQVVHGTYKIPPNVATQTLTWDFDGASQDYALNCLVFDPQDPPAEGDIAAVLPPFGQDLTASIEVEGNVAATLPALGAELEGFNNRLSAVVEAALPMFSSSLLGRRREGLPGGINIRPRKNPLRWFTSAVRWREL